MFSTYYCRNGKLATMEKVGQMSDSYAIFSAQYPPHLGGIENFTSNLARALVDGGDSVVVVTNDTNSVGSGVTEEDGVKVLRFPCLPFVDGRLPIVKSCEETRELWKWLNQQKFDGVLINARFYPHSIAGMKFACKKGLKPVVLDHGSAYLSFSNAVLDPIVRAYERLITSWGKRYGAAYYGISQRSAEWLSEFGISAEGVIPNAIDAEAYRGLSSGRDFRGELGLDADRVIAAFVGRFIPEKGINSIIEASRSKELSKAGVTFVLAGDGPLSERVDRSQGESLRWVGRLGASDVSALLQQANLLCLPSRSEGFSMTLLEAAVCSCPAVATDVGVASELIPNEEFGTIIDSTDADDIARAVGRLASDRDLLTLQGENSCRRAELCFSWEATIGALRAASKKP